MKAYNLLTTIITLTVIILLSQGQAQARHNTMVGYSMIRDTTTPPTTTMAPDTMPAKAEKEKKEGFNSKTRFGIRGGGVISKQDYESSDITVLSEDTEGKVGADLGIVVTIPVIGGFFAVQPELHWVQKGYKYTNTTAQEIKTNLDYFEIPVLARFNFGGSLRIYGFAGPSFGWLLDGSYDPDNGLDPTDYLKETETSGVVGVGVGIGTFEFDIRYIAGLSDVSNAEEFKDAKNSSYGAGITLKF